MRGGSQPHFVDAVPDDAAALLREICETHLVQYRENAAAYARGDTHFAMTVQGVRYAKLPVSRFRLWCLEQLRAGFAALDAQAQERVRALLPHHDAAILWEGEVAASGFNEDNHLPFGKAINVYGQGIPP